MKKRFTEEQIIPILKEAVCNPPFLIALSSRGLGGHVIPDLPTGPVDQLKIILETKRLPAYRPTDAQDQP